LGLTLDELKDNDEEFENNGLKLIIEKSLLDTTGGVSIDFVGNMFGGRFSIQPKIPFSGAGEASQCGGGCSC
jgi:Fe-S cluster assembly iron-binding protein IscA